LGFGKTFQKYFALRKKKQSDLYFLQPNILRLYVPDMTLNCKRWWECSWEALNVMGNGKPFIPSIFPDPPLPGVVAPARAPAIKQIFFFKED